VKSCSHGKASETFAVEVTNAEERFIGPFVKDWFEASDGLVAIAYSGVTLLTIAVLELDADGV
jgi:hypothetical protein